MWGSRSLELTDRRGLWFGVERGGAPASFAEVVQAWRDDVSFREWFNALLADVPYSAYRWETPAVTARTATRRFEFVLLDSPGLARRPDPEPFAEHLAGPPGSGVVTFPNLRGDAIMVVPRLLASPSAYGHLAAFVREAPGLQRHALWQAVGDAMAGRLGAKPVWLSTAGAGVSWLHARLDDQPKYYGYGPYRLEALSAR